MVPAARDGWIGLAVSPWHDPRAERGSVVSTDGDHPGQSPRRSLVGARAALWARWRGRLQGGPRSRAAPGRPTISTATLVEGARAPAFFRELGVPDTPEGRFEMIALHVALAVRRLRREGASGPGARPGAVRPDAHRPGPEPARARGRRSIGLGRYVKRLAQNFNARLATLDETLSSGRSRPAGRDDRAQRAPWGDIPPDARRIAALRTWLIEQDRGLTGQDSARLLRGDIALLAPNPHIA